MNSSPFIRKALFVVALALASLPQTSLACAACFGRSDSRLAEGFNLGILSLLAVIGFVLAGITAFFIYQVRRASALEARNAGLPVTTK